MSMTAHMLEHGSAILTATDSSIGQSGLPLSWVLVLAIGGAAAVGAIIWALVSAMRRPAPWERPRRERQ